MARKLLPPAAPAPTNNSPAGQAALDAIAAMGYDIVNQSYTAGQVAQILLSKSTSASQIALLYQHGYDTTQGATIGQYQAAMKEIQGA